MQQGLPVTSAEGQAHVPTRAPHSGYKIDIERRIMQRKNVACQKKNTKTRFFNQKTCVCQTFLVPLQRKNVSTC